MATNGYQFENGTANSVDAIDNYWGTSDPDQAADEMDDHSDDSTRGRSFFHTAVEQS